MKRKLLFVAALAVITGVQKANAYSTENLTSDGWAKVENISEVENNYYILVDVTKPGFAMASTTENVPVYNKVSGVINQVWEFVATDNGKYYIQNAYNEKRVASGPHGWDDKMDNEGTAYSFEISDGKWLISSIVTVDDNNKIDEKRYLGPWQGTGTWGTEGNDWDMGSNKNHYQRVAANKKLEDTDPGEVTEGFYIYSIAKSTYNAQRATEEKLLAAGWQKATTKETLGLAGNDYLLIDSQMWGYAMTHTSAGRPLYTAMKEPAPSDEFIWTMKAKGEGFALQRPDNSEYFVVPTNQLWATAYNTSDDNAEFTYILSDGAWSLQRAGATQYVGRWSDVADYPYEGEQIAANKNVGESRTFSIYQIPTTVASAEALPIDGTMEANTWYYFDIAATANYALLANDLDGIQYTTISTAERTSTFATKEVELTPQRYYVKSTDANELRLALTDKVSITTAEYTAYVTTFDVDFTQTDGITAYKVTRATADGVELEKITEAPAREAVILNGANDDYTIIQAKAAVEKIDNEFKAGGNQKGDGNTIYALGNKEGVGFYLVKEGVDVPANKGYLEIVGALAKTFIPLGSEGEATGIEAVEAQGNEETVIYNLAGQRVANPTNGIYIVNGKKVLINK